MISSATLATLSYHDDRNNKEKLIECEDISLLPHPEVHLILDLLAVRYSDKRIYSKCGEVLLATNPYEDVSHILYTDELLFRYSNPRSLSALDPLPPHPWKTAAKAFRCLFNDEIPNTGGGSGIMHSGKLASQSIIISGESGR